MKIKRFDNLWTMGVILVGVILGIIYLVKCVFPEFVIEVSHIEQISKIGRFIDTNKWAWYVATFFTSFFVYYFTICACCKKKYLNKKELLIVTGTILLLFLVKEFLPAQYTSVNITSMILIPFICKADFKATTIVFAISNFVQTMTLEIRNLSLMIIDFNYATFLILTIDVYIVLLLLYLLFNHRKENE